MFEVFKNVTNILIIFPSITPYILLERVIRIEKPSFCLKWHNKIVYFQGDMLFIIIYLNNVI